MKRLAGLLLSPRVALLALALVTGLLLLSSLAPGYAEPGALVRSPLFLALAGFLAAAVLASLATRLRAHLRARREDGPPPLERHALHWSVVLPLPRGEAAARVRRGLRGAGLVLLAPGPRAQGGSRRAVGFWGSMAFHAGLLVTLAGICASALGRFGAVLTIVEGVPVELTRAAQGDARSSSVACGLDGARLAVSDVSATYADLQRLTDVAGVLALHATGAPPRKALVGVNLPAEVGDCQLTVERYGFAPEVQAWDPAGRVRADGLAMVRARPPGAEDAQPLEGGGALHLRLFPDYLDRAGTPGSRSRVPLRPVLGFRWVEGEREVAAGLVPLGDEVEVNGHRVAFRRLRYWLGFLIARDPGLPWFAAGGLLCLAGLAVRFGLPPRAWRLRVEEAPGGSSVDLWVSARHGPATLRHRLERLQRDVAAGAGT